MKLSQNLTQRLDTRLKLSQDLYRAIGFMELSNLELAHTLREVASDNPWLKVRIPRAIADADGDIAAYGPSLRTYVLSQIDRLLTRAADRPVALALLDTMGQSGFLEAPIETVATALRIPLSRVEAVLMALQRIEPRGLLARSLGECLALQLAAQEDLSPQMRRLLDALPLLAERGPAALAAAIGLDHDTMESMLDRLRALDPRPAAAFTIDVAPTRIADLLFEKDGTTWTARLNPDSLPGIEIRDLNKGGVAAGSFLRERRSALHLVNAIQKRNENLLALGALLAREQGRFLSEGVIGQKAFTRREAARQLDLHESTVCRLASSTSAATPGMGVLPLRRFFARPLRKVAPDSSEMGALAVTALIVRMVASEDRDFPLTDGALTDQLTAQGITLSRRVVAKLRAKAGIPNRATRRK